MRPNNRFIFAAAFAVAAASFSTSAVAQERPGRRGGPAEAELRKEKRPQLKARWENAGWVMLGQRVVQGKNDTDAIMVGRKEGKFTRLMVVVEGDELEMNSMEIEFGNGQKVDAGVRHFFKENSATRQIDLPGEQRAIKRIVFKYGNLPGGGKSKVQVWAKEGDAGPGPGPGSVGGGGGVLTPKWNQTGWVKLGERVVQGKNDTDTIPVGRQQGNFTRLMLTVAGSEVEMHDMQIEFGNGQKWDPQVRHFFRERSATRSIDLPGVQRKINKVMFKYGNLPGGGRAKVELWAQDPDRVRTARMTAAQKWWQLRERELAKIARDRAAWLKAEEARWAAEREQRRQARLAEIRARWEASFLGQAAVVEELTRHAQRMARLNRMLLLAEGHSQPKVAVRVRFLMDAEQARHDRQMMALNIR